jgi:hypothetical protein
VSNYMLYTPLVPYLRNTKQTLDPKSELVRVSIASMHPPSELVQLVPARIGEIKRKRHCQEGMLRYRHSAEAGTEACVYRL